MTFAPGLLGECRVAVAGEGAAASHTATRMRALGAEVHQLPGGALADEESAAAWARDRGPLHALVVDAGAAFGSGGPDGLRAAMEGTWRAIRAAATAAMIEAQSPGRLLLVAPRADAGRHAGAVRAGLENLARTLSVEWARYGITVVALWPGATTTDGELAELTCFLLSPAGGYFSGCRFELGSTPVATA